MDAYRLQVKELETLREIARQAKHELRLTMEFLERRQIDTRELDAELSAEFGERVAGLRPVLEALEAKE